MHVLDELAARGFIKQITDEPGLRQELSAGPTTLYLGIDPTAVSLHMGNFLQLMLLSHFVRAGHRVILITGAGDCDTAATSSVSDRLVSLRTLSSLSKSLGMETGFLFVILYGVFSSY